MKSEWEAITAKEFCYTVTDGTHDSPKAKENGHYLITSKHLSPYNIDFSSAKKISEEDYQKIIKRSPVEQWDILFSMIGTIGITYLEKNIDIDYACKNMGIFKFNGDKDKAYWLYYYLQTPQAKEYILGHLRGTTQQYLPLGSLRDFPVQVPSTETRNLITSILRNIDDKIALNAKINENLEQQAQAIFKSWFVDNPNDNRITCRADEYFDISIGKTPPRKEHHWFSNNSDDMVWVSISDMGSCGTFIENSSEYLTKEAVKKFNVKTVPENTVILSFKLTVGRVAITANTLTTNEAIAHFKTDNKRIVEYLFCYLKQFDYQSLGSTSSIATAVNSKIIKGMPFIIPTNDEITNYHKLVSPMFLEILKNQRENQRLSALRDTLLPKLMNGEIDVSRVRI